MITRAGGPPVSRSAVPRGRRSCPIKQRAPVRDRIVDDTMCSIAATRTPSPSSATSPRALRTAPVASLAERFGIAAWDGELPPTTVAPFASLIGQSEGDPFGGPVAMRLEVGGSCSTVGRTRLVVCRGSLGRLIDLVRGCRWSWQHRTDR